MTQQSPRKLYAPLTASDLKLLGEVAGFDPPSWSGPALPRPAGSHAMDEILAIVSRMLARGQYLEQAQDGLSTLVTLHGITAPAERFTLGTTTQVERGAALRAIFLDVESFLTRSGWGHWLEAHVLPGLERVAGALVRILPSSSDAPASPDHADYSAFALEDLRQYAMGWTRLEDVYRHGYPNVDAYVHAASDAAAATEQFWPIFSAAALPYNLLVLQHLTAGNAEPFRTRLGLAWTHETTALLDQGRLYGIDLTIFEGLAPQTLANGTTRCTPSTMALLAMGTDGTPRPIAIYVADPMDPARSEIYGPASPAWIYSLMALKTSLTVHGIWIGHVYTLHVVTAAMQMAMWNTLPADHILHRMLAPQSRFTIAFDFLLLAGWSRLSPPTSISDSAKFMALCNKYAAGHDFFSTDPPVMLAALGLNAADFTDPGQADWNRYPNVARMLRLWDLTKAYVQGVVDAGYPNDAAVAHDAALQAWITEAAAPAGGNVVGLPRVQTRPVLAQLLTSLLYRVIFHGMGRLRSMGTPAPSFAPNLPPTLQSARIPAATEPVTTAVLLVEFLPRTGTVGELLTFYDIFSFNAPYTPLVPAEGPDAGLFFDPDRHAVANAALVTFRRGIEAVVAHEQPDWVQTGQWPMNIEL